MKNWYQSKTVWFNIITILIAILTQLSTIVESQDVKNAILAAVGFGNIILRVFSTSEPIETKAKVKAFIAGEKKAISKVLAEGERKKNSGGD